MPRYHYKSLTASGELRTGWRTAADVGELEQQLQRNGEELLRARKAVWHFHLRKPNRAQRILFFS
ncbi:MAG: hypothetical protein LBE50_02670, partial [Gallionellaceae bacterium]|nr:hypothetical protein [Gallionellaceae bacterium]